MMRSFRTFNHIGLAPACILLVAALIACGPSSSFDDRWQKMNWGQIASEARGQTVNFYLWGGSDTTNRYVSAYLGQRLKHEHGVTLNRVPVTDSSVYVNKVLGEKQANLLSGGSVDLVWINGENFRTMKTGGLLLGPYAHLLPNMEYVDTTAASIANDFGFPTDGFETPWGASQFVMAYDSARLPDPPTSIDELMVWIKNNPGKFTYAAMPDFTGSVFVRHLLYHVAGGHEDLLGPFDQAKFDAVSGKLWDLLNEIKPYLWRQGRTYPETQTQLRTLFANGEVWFDMSYNPVDAALKINEGMYPPTVRTFVFESGTIANTHYVAIPFNASAKAGAMVLANLMLDPEAQYEKARPEVWGDAPAMNLTKLHPRWQRAFAELPRHEAMLSPEELNRKQLPELQADWLAAVEEGWRTHVLGR